MIPSYIPHTNLRILARMPDYSFEDSVNLYMSYVDQKERKAFAGQIDWIEKPEGLDPKGHVKAYFGPDFKRIMEGEINADK